MAPLKVLICGGGIAGPSLAFWLAHSGHQVVVVERFPALRATGAQVDLRGQGIEVLKRMGLLDDVRNKLVDEVGVSLVDSKGNSKATIMANKSGHGAQSLTSEFEIMRGDLVRILYESTKDDVQYIFGKTVESFEQDDQQVVAHFSDGTSDIFDLLVGADGQGSHVRKALLPPVASEPYRRLGIHMAYWFIPRTGADTEIRQTYNSPGGRMMMRRSHNPTESQVYFFLRANSPELASIQKAPIEKQKEFWSRKFHDAGWQTGRFLEGLKDTRSWYCQEVVQVCTDTWYKGRVVLLGDAAYCASPFSGMGTTSSLVGAYVLAGEINQSLGDLSQAFSNYDRTLRPYVNEVQQVKPALIRMAMPETRFGIAILHFFAALLYFLRVPELLTRFSSENKGGWEVPEYEELKGSQLRK